MSDPSEAVGRARHLRASRAADVPHKRHRRPAWVLWTAAALPVILLVAVVTAWLVDTAGADVARNVELAGVDISGMAEEELPAVVADVAADFSTADVEIVTSKATYPTTAAEIGVAVDQEATTAAALDTADQGFVLARPFRWAASHFRQQDAELEFTIDEAVVAAKILELQGANRVPPTEPTVELVEGHFNVVPGVDGSGIDPAALVEALGEAAETGARPIRVEIEPVPIEPNGSDEAAADAARGAEALLAEPVEIRTPGGSRSVDPEALRSWAVLQSVSGGKVSIVFDQAKVNATLREAFADIDGAPKPATFTLEGGAPVILPDQPGLVCCQPDSGAKILAALNAGTRGVDLALVEGRSTFTSAEAQKWGITQAVGGNHAWRSGGPTTAGPGFTTYHACCASRVANIHRMADLVRGAVVAPGASFSINDHVGERTAEKGFVTAGAIRDGKHVDEIGGGVSQFATTMFNAAYFAGLDIDSYQAHSEYIDRYPRGREATMGYPEPDLQFTNNTPYGILIWTSYTDTSLTVTMYSSPYATAEQTGIDESTSGRCQVVTTTRTRTFPDGTSKQDTFKATYRPGEGQFC
jgi:vancomycin resistance protein YoaR